MFLDIFEPVAKIAEQLGFKPEKPQYHGRDLYRFIHSLNGKEDKRLKDKLNSAYMTARNMEIEYHKEYRNPMLTVQNHSGGYMTVPMTLRQKAQRAIEMYMEEIVNKSLKERKDYGDWLDGLEQIKEIAEPVKQWNELWVYLYQIGMISDVFLYGQLHDELEEVLNEQTRVPLYQ